MAENRVKVWRATKDAKAAIQISEDTVQIIGSDKSAIEVNGSGVGVVSKSFSFGMNSSEIRTGGMFTMMNDFACMIPSTMVTPVAQRMPFPPLGFIMGLVPIIPMFMAVFSAVVPV